MPSLAHAAGVQPRFDLSSPPGRRSRAIADTVDSTQDTCLRVNLPKPNCTVRPSDCADIDVLNTLDGFNMQPRISIPFTGAIDPTSVNSSNVFLISLPDFEVTGINQVVWEVATNTLHVESDQLLRQHTTYILVVTTGVRGRSRDAHRLGVLPPPTSHGEMPDLVRGARPRNPPSLRRGRRRASSRPRARRRCSSRCAARSTRPPRPLRTSCSAPAASGRCSRPRT